MRPLHRRRLLAGFAAATLTLGLAACGGDDETEGAATGSVSDADVQAALQKGGELTVWAWEPTLKQVVAKFQETYPKVKVNLVNAGTGNDQYTALQNAVSVAALILTAQTLIADIPDDEDPTAGRARGGGAEKYGMS